MSSGPDGADDNNEDDDGAYPLIVMFPADLIATIARLLDDGLLENLSEATWYAIVLNASLVHSYIPPWVERRA